jgi:thiopeptide-type bacteriocin biosynthesis protein
MRECDLWCSFHIHYHDFGAQDKVILRCVAPLVDHLESKGVVRRYFFIRYFEYGPHIRLRLYPANSAVAEDVRNTTLAHVTRFLEAEPAADLDLPVTPKVPNNSVHEVVYEPETTRYGGVRGVAIAEDHFHQSSKAAIAVIRSVHNLSSSEGRRFIGAVELATMIAYSGGFVSSRTVDYINDHLSHIVMPAPHSFSVLNVPAATLTSLVARVRRVAHLYEDSTSRDCEHGLRPWKTAMDETCASLHAHLRSEPSYRETHSRLGCSRKYALILQSCTHMLLNRLGYWGRSEQAVLRAVRDLAVFAGSRPVLE